MMTFDPIEVKSIEDLSDRLLFSLFELFVSLAPDLPLLRQAVVAEMERRTLLQ